MPGKKTDFMLLEDAIEIVLELARLGAAKASLDIDDLELLEKVKAEHELAIDTVNDFACQPRGEQLRSSPT